MSGLFLPGLLIPFALMDTDLLKYFSHWIFKILQKNQENIKEQKQKVYMKMMAQR